jgi:DNA-binding NarL/FixJ family response regulator
VDEGMTTGRELRREQVVPAARIVLAEAAPTGTLHYLLEAEGFRVVGCASNEVELNRVLAQGISPDAIVLDRDITVSSLSVASELAPDAEVIVIWPDGVQAPTGTRRVAPRLVYEELGPAIRFALAAGMPRDPVAPAATALDAIEPPPDVVSAMDDASPRLARTAARTSVMSIVLIAAVVMTMGAVMAVGGARVKEGQAAKRMIAAQTAAQVASTQTHDRRASQPSGPPAKTPLTCEQGPRWSSNERAAEAAPGAHDKRCPTRAGGTANKPDHAENSQPSDPGQSNDGHGQTNDGHGHSNDPHGQSDDPHGQSNDPHGQSDDPHGQSDDPHGKSEDPPASPTSDGNVGGGTDT